MENVSYITSLEKYDYITELETTKSSASSHHTKVVVGGTSFDRHRFIISFAAIV